MNFKILISAVLSLLLVEIGTSFAQKPAATPAGQSTDRKFNFTPTVTEQISDGVPYRTVLFADGNRRMQLSPPTKWLVSGSAGEMFFQRPDLSGARITLRASTLPVPEKLDERWTESVKPLVLASLPKTSNKQLIANAAPNVINIAGWTSAEIKTTYDEGGKRFASDWIFLRLADGRLLEVISTSREEDFPSVRAAMMDALRGWGTAPFSPGSR